MKLHYSALHAGAKRYVPLCSPPCAHTLTIDNQGEARARQKSKAELEAEAEANREAALATALPETNKGFKMMAKMGFKQGQSLGKSEDARKEPIQVTVKDDRSGIGLESEKKRKYREQWEAAAREAKRQKEEEGDFVENRKLEVKAKQLESDLYSAQRTAERLFQQDEEEKGVASGEEKPWKQVNLLWRGRARYRAEKKRDQRSERELKNSLASRLPGYAADDDQDNDDSVALGLDTKPFYTSLENDVEVEDPELAEFDALPVEERLRKVLVYLRETWNYCFYCGYRYPDAQLDGCPGVTAEDHD